MRLWLTGIVCATVLGTGLKNCGGSEKVIHETKDRAQQALDVMIDTENDPRLYPEKKQQQKMKK